MVPLVRPVGAGRTVALAVLVGVIGCAGCATAPAVAEGPWLTVLAADDTVVAEFSVAGGDEVSFAVEWTHSVELERWREEFAVTRDGAIEIRSTRFRTFGAGTPDLAPEARIEDGWVVMSGIDRVVDPLVVRAGTTTDHRLIAGDRTLDLEPGQYRFVVTYSCTARTPQTRGSNQR